MLFLVSRTLAQGRAAGFVSLAGTSSGFALHALAAAFGLSALLAAVPLAFEVVKWAGALYLAWLAIVTWRSSDAPEAGTDAPPAARGAMYRQGLWTAVLNPKVAIFYLTFLPQFIAPGQPVLTRSLMLASIHIVMGLIWLTAYAWFIDRLGSVLTRPAVKAWLERVTGGLLVAIGARLAWERR